MKAFYTILLLIVSNVFMTFAWYGHLKLQEMKVISNWPLYAVILFSWMIALAEYAFQIPANRIGFIGAGTIILQKQIVRGLTTAAGIWATAGIGLAVGAGMYVISIAATLLTLAGLELLSILFKRVGMKSSMITFSTGNKDILKEVSDRFNSRNYMLVSYKMERLGSGDTERYIVTMIIKSKRSNDEGHMLSLMQEWPDVTVEQIE